MKRYIAWVLLALLLASLACTVRITTQLDEEWMATNDTVNTAIAQTATSPWK